MSRAHEIRDLMEAGLTQRAIGRSLGISGPAVSQAIAKVPELRALRTKRSQGEKERLAAYRSELRQTLTQVRRLAIDINRSIRVLDEELQSVEIDRLIGLR
jgi:predicted transcriptional regulator